MTPSPQAALGELLSRLTASGGAAVYVDDHELEQWPPNLVANLKAMRMLSRASPARSAVCNGCERSCLMPVEVLPDDGRGAAAFIVCDKRTDINRVEVAIGALARWKATGESLADALTHLLKVDTRPRHADSAGRWPLGMLVGKHHKDHLVLFAGDGALKLAVAGHELELADVLAVASHDLSIDRAHLVRLVDRPTGSVAAGAESADERRTRLQALVAEHQKRSPRKFLKAAADQEGITVYALKQVIYRPAKAPDAMNAMAVVLARPVSKRAKNQR